MKSVRFNVEFLGGNAAAAGEIFRDFLHAVQKCFIACCKFEDDVKVYMSLLTPSSLIGACNNVLITDYVYDRQ